MSRNFSFKLVPEGHCVPPLVVLLWIRALLELPLGTVFRICALSTLFKGMLTTHPVRSGLTL